tara:strand:- start:3081 stop:4031 length:951 start_codon:yes stop_codon:yes gene_type:complete
MRQAGRYLPEFREIREKNTDFIKLCLDSNLVKEITIQPLKRFDLDAAIIFSDILMIPYGLNQKVEFKKGYGPVLGNLNIERIINTSPKEFIKRIKPVYEGISKVKTELGNKNLIGFVGAPWTLLVYMINRKSPKKNFSFNDVVNDKSQINDLLKKIEETICIHVREQVKAGANLIQIFDSWAGLLPEKELQRYCYMPTLRIVDYLKSLNIPVICFPKGIGKNYSNFNSVVKPNCINIDYEVDPKWIKKKLKGTTIQGGLDPKTLLKDHKILKKEVENYLNTFSDYPYIFNLGHGVLPETKPETIKYITDIVRNKKW